MVTLECGYEGHACGMFIGKNGPNACLWPALAAGAHQLDGGYPCKVCGPRRCLRIVNARMWAQEGFDLFIHPDYYKYFR